MVIGGTILQNTIKQRLPASFTADIAGGTQIAYALIPTIVALPEPLKAQVRGAFADGVALIWRVMAGISGAGLLSCLLMREVPLRADMDETWVIEDVGGVVRSDMV